VNQMCCCVWAVRLGFAEILLSCFIAAPAVAVRPSRVSTRFAFVVVVACIEAFALWLPVQPSQFSTRLLAILASR
jgi:hypothetical protein